MSYSRPRARGRIGALLTRTGVVRAGLLVLALSLGMQAFVPSNASFTSKTTNVTNTFTASTNAMDFMLRRNTSTELVWWLDSAKQTTLYSNTTCTTSAAVAVNVKCWVDVRPGHSKITTSGSGMPRTASTINGINPVRFAGTGFMSGPDLLGGSTSQLTVFLVTREVSRINNFLFSLDGTATGATRMTMHTPWSNGVFYSDLGSVATDRASITTPYPVGTATVLTGWKDNATGRNYLTLNGGSLSTSVGSTTPSTAGGLMLGDIGGYLSNHDVAELLVFKTTLNAADRTTVTNYLRTKWGTA